MCFGEGVKGVGSEGGGGGCCFQCVCVCVSKPCWGDWRSGEEGEGLYLESLGTLRIYFPKLQEIKDPISHTCHFGSSSIKY